MVKPFNKPSTDYKQVKEYIKEKPYYIRGYEQEGGLFGGEI